MKKLIAIIVIVFTFQLIVNGQYYSNQRVKTIAFSENIELDTLSIVPNSLKIKLNNIEVLHDSLYAVDYMKSKIYFTSRTYNYPKLFRIIYRVFPVNFSAVYPKTESKLFSKTDSNNNKPKSMVQTSHFSKPKEKNTLIVNGNISRGISVGNNQNMVVNSNLNLQLSGKLSDNIMIEAYLSDKNIPLQPNGYTQQIQEFDKIYIRLYDSTSYLQMGDVNVKGTNSYFLKFNKSLMGGDLAHVEKKTGKYKNTTQLSGAIAKGNYSRAEIKGIEAVQGPYKLNGANNETYIIILAGSEKIYLDGQELERGENADYVIDYNTAELSFTPKNIITKDSRIIAEFEYSDKNYNRFLVYAQNNLAFKKGSFSVQYFNESDAKNQPVNLLLSNREKQIMADAGDNPLNATVKKVDSVGYDQNRVLYKLIDTTVNTLLYDSVLVHSYNVNNAFYSASFALVGENKGNYIAENSIANGKVYKWVAPINNIPQGNYEPLQLLVAPVKHQVFIGNLNYKVTSNTNLGIEIALSENDKNTFSDVDSHDNKGLALRAKVQQKIPLESKDIFIQANYESISKSFKGIEKFRSAEFNRDWNLSNAVNEQEHLIEAEIGLAKKKKEIASFKTQFLKRELGFEGIKNNAAADISIFNFKLVSKASLLNTSEEEKNTQFYRHNITLNKNIGLFNVGVNHSYEDNQLTNKTTDSLLFQSAKFSEWQSRLFLPDTLKRNFALAFKYRTNFLPQNNQMNLASTTQDVSGIFNLKKSQINNLSATITWRNLHINNPILNPTLKDEANFMGRVDHSLRLKKSWLSFFTFYEIGTGMETRKDYSYLEVANGQGIYIWVDYNSNNIPELNEFEISPFPEEANYIRIYTPTNDYIKVYSLKLNETVKISADKIWRSKKGVRKLISRFGNTSTLQINQKHSNENITARMNPFQLNLADTQLINNSANYRNVFNFNRTNPKFGADWIYQNLMQKRLITNGFEQSMVQRNEVKLRWNMFASLLLLNTTGFENKTFDSEFFSSKNYDIESFNNRATLQWQPYTIFRIAMHYETEQKNNLLGAEKTMIHIVGPEMKYSWPAKGYINAKASIINVDYNSTSNNAIAYQMMDGHQNGENYQWSVNISRLLNKFIQLNFSYNGRKPSERSIIHTGHFSVSAVF